MQWASCISHAPAKRPGSRQPQLNSRHFPFSNVNSSFYGASSPNPSEEGLHRRESRPFGRSVGPILPLSPPKRVPHNLGHVECGIPEEGLITRRKRFHSCGRVNRAGTTEDIASPALHFCTFPNVESVFKIHSNVALGGRHHRLMSMT